MAMDSRLGPVARPDFRHTEAADGRPAVVRDEKREQNRKDRERGEAAETPDPWQDITTVSIPALMAFLHGLGRHSAEPVVSVPGPAAAPPAVSAAAKASRAYQATYKAAHPETPAALPPEQQKNDPSGLSIDENRRIHRLLDRLAQLQERGVHTLTIKRAGTFLESLEMAVAEL